MNYYEDKLKDGNKYENFVVEKLKEEGIKITLTKTFEEQINIGESYEGYEIKFDDKYKETGNLYIETYEKTNPNNLEYIPSGINRIDNTTTYIIGNYDVIFLFSKTVLQLIKDNYNEIENKLKTSKGFLLSYKDINKYVTRIITIKQTKVEEFM